MYTQYQLDINKRGLAVPEFIVVKRQLMGSFYKENKCPIGTVDKI